MALTCAELEERSIMKDQEMRRLKDDFLYGGSSVSDFDGVMGPRYVRPPHHAKNCSSHQDSRDSVGTPLRERVLLGQTSNLPPRCFGNSGARSTAKKPMHEEGATPKIRNSSNQH